MSLAQSTYVFQPMIDANGVINFMDGLIFGLTQKEDLKEIQQCMTHASDLALQITAAVEDFEKKDLEDILKGIGEIGKIIEEIPNDFADCSTMQGDLKRIESWGKIFENPVELAKVLGQNVLKNFQPILGDISKIPTDFSGGQFKNAGEDVADIMVLSLGPIPEARWGNEL